MKKIIGILVICILLTTGCSVKKTSEVTDEEKFAMEYGVSEDNPFKYLSIKETENLFLNGSGIVYFGNSNDEDSRYVSNFLIEILEETDIDKIYYCDPTKLVKKEKSSYENLLKTIKEKLELEEFDEIKIPSIYIIKDGEITSLDKDSLLANLDDNDDLNTTDKSKIKDIYVNFFENAK